VTDHTPELTTVERASVLRACREKRDSLRQACDHLKTQARLGDRTADAAATVVDAELSILTAAIRVLWKQSGCEPPISEL
jgi:putative heme iron utilization protein